MASQELDQAKDIIETPRPYEDFFTFTRLDQTILVNDLFALRYDSRGNSLGRRFIVATRRNVPSLKESLIRQGLIVKATDSIRPVYFHYNINTNPNHRVYVGKNFPYRISCQEKMPDRVTLRFEGSVPINIRIFKITPGIKALLRLVETTPIT